MNSLRLVPSGSWLVHLRSCPAAGGSVVDSPQCARQLLLKTTTDYGWGVVMILYQIITYFFTLFFHTFISHIKSMKYHTFFLLYFITDWFDSVNALAVNDDIKQAKED